MADGSQFGSMGMGYGQFQVHPMTGEKYWHYADGWYSDSQEHKQDAQIGASWLAAPFTLGLSLAAPLLDPNEPEGGRGFKPNFDQGQGGGQGQGGYGGHGHGGGQGGYGGGQGGQRGGNGGFQRH